MDINGHECYLLDNCTLDTVIEVDGHEFRFSDTNDYRDPSMGDITKEGFEELCEQCIDDLWQFDDEGRDN